MNSITEQKTQGRGAIVKGDGVLFRIWAPQAERVEVVLEQRQQALPLQMAEAGWFEHFVPKLNPGALYRFRVDGGPLLPDPASRFQPEGVHGPSMVIDPASFDWHDDQWQGIPQKQLIFYELHTGTFTSKGSFRAVQEQLEYLKQLGITAVELMPVADFPGRWNWGYDQAALFAPSRAYGIPDDLRALVNAAHRLGLAVFLDVIYNHFGPDGAYAAAVAPVYTEKHQTPWGKAVNLDDEHCAGVRQFFIDNALHWLEEYHFDGLRLDAVHALQDDSEIHFLAELSEAVESLPGRKRFLVAEDERNLRRLVEPRHQGGYGLDAVWADDFHHQMRNITAGDKQGYYRDFVGTTAADLATTLRQGWFYTGQFAEQHAAPRGTATEGLAPEQFVICIQNHDQIGNRPTGDRLHHQIPAPLYRAASALLLFAPQLPLLFMGQEWASSSPFQFFTDHNDQLGPLVSEGRKKEFEHFEGFQNDVPDPQDSATFYRSRLRWEELETPAHGKTRDLYRDLLALRRKLQGELEITVHSTHALTVTRGKHHLVVALKEDLRLPRPDQGQIVLSTEQPQYSQSPQPPHVEERLIHFAVPGAVVLERGT